MMTTSASSNSVYAMGGVILLLVLLYVFVLMPYSVSLAVRDPRFQTKDNDEPANAMNITEVIGSGLFPVLYLITRAWIPDPN